MSFEGYYQLLCEKGHLSEIDVYASGFSYDGFEDEDLNDKCHCGAKFIHCNTVDETNGIDEETGVCPGYREFELKKETKCEYCDTVLERLYVTPTERPHNAPEWPKTPKQG